MKTFLMTAFGKDRPGIVADVTEVIYETGCNLEDASMTRLAGLVSDPESGEEIPYTIAVMLLPNLGFSPPP